MDQQNSITKIAKRFRWNLLTYRSNSGKTMFVCSSCGRHSSTPDKACPPREGVDLHCEDWPEHPDHSMTLCGIEKTFNKLESEGLLTVHRER